jgi:hypothetical protein
MRYNGAEFSAYLDAFKDVFDIAEDKEATNKIARVMQVVLPIHRWDDLDPREVSVRDPVQRREPRDADGEKEEGSGQWGGDVVDV